LNKSDIYPMYTVPFGTVTAMQLSPNIGNTKNSPYLVSRTFYSTLEQKLLFQTRLICSVHNEDTADIFFQQNMLVQW
jgi:hypothetical protein